MNNIVDILAIDMLDILKTKFKDNYTKVHDVKIFWHNLNYLLFSVLNYKRLYNDEISLNKFKELNLIPEQLVQFQIDNNEITEKFIERVLTLFDDHQHYKLSDIHEQLLGREICISKSNIELQTGKSRRDSTGSYYTPTELANSMISKIFSESTYYELVDQKQETIKIADLSCGSGEFFEAVQLYLYDNYSIPYEQSGMYLWGFDVDPIALQICICNILVKAKIENWKKIISHFYLGNPLIHIEKEGSFDDKCTLFALGRYYANEMGINFESNKLQHEFDLILGNPPWEKIRFEEKKFFSCCCPKIASISKKDDRIKAINALKEEWKELYDWYSLVKNDYSLMCNNKYKHPLIMHANSGELNTYSLFTELAYNLLNESGLCSLIVKGTLATAPAHKNLWSFLINQKSVKSVYLFKNKNKIFDIDSREIFAIITISHILHNTFYFAAGLCEPNDINTTEPISLTTRDVRLLNPFTNMIPNVSCTTDIGILLDMHKKFPIYNSVYPDCHFGRLIHLTSHADYIDKVPSSTNIPIYEGKFIEQYDARFSTFAGMESKKKYANKASAVKNVEINGEKPRPESRYFVQCNLWEKYYSQYPKEYSLCWRSLTSSTNARTTIAMILPTCPTCQSIQMLQIGNNTTLLMLLGLFNSIPFDYLVRLKMPGIDLTQSVIKQIPVPNEAVYEQEIEFDGRVYTLKEHILSYVHYLLNCEDSLFGLLDDTKQGVYKVSEKTSTEDAKKKLDRLFAIAYGIDDILFDEIIKTFSKY